MSMAVSGIGIFLYGIASVQDLAALLKLVFMSNGLDVSSDCLKEEEDRRLSSYFWLLLHRNLGLGVDCLFKLNPKAFSDLSDREDTVEILV